MMIFKCKICGGELNIERGQSIVECEYCGVKQTLPRFFDKNVKLMYDRANNYLLHNEFDKAENIYNQILYTDKEDADAYWSLVLCKYGITYVKDPKTGKYIPTCNRTYYSSIFDDENYKNAIKYANEEKKALFEADAKTIDDIQHSIIAISRKEKPFDIFISYKETGANGGRTKDSIVAQDLYEKLTSEGYKVFFSRITLEDKIGTEYEPYIYAALASSKVMITICSSRENIEAVWVKNEWSRFLAFCQKDSTKTILPLYFDMDNTDLPDEFAHLPSYDMKKDGFEQELLRGIKKLIPLPIMEKERREKRKKLLKKIGLGAVACLVVAAICMIPWFMKMPDYNTAMQLYYDKNYPEATWAFDELGSYRNSKAMKGKCEKSWRKSLATVVSYGRNWRSGDSYYITPNGTVECLDPGDSQKDLIINEHGKIVSITAADSLFALYEDGYVANVTENNNIEDSSEWHDIVQISPLFNATNIALRSDGKILHGNTDGTKGLVKLYLSDDDKRRWSDDWLKETSSWSNIISFDYYTIWSSGGELKVGAIVGVKSNGTLCAVFHEDYVYSDEFSSEYETISDYKDMLNKFYDVKEVKVRPDKILALTNHNTVMTLQNGEFTEYDNTKSIIDFGDDTFRTSNGDVFAENNLVIKDVVYLDEFIITRSGSVYSLNYNDTVENKNVKAIVYDEWTERLK